MNWKKLIILLLVLQLILPGSAFAEGTQGVADLYGNYGLVSVVFTGAQPELLKNLVIISEAGETMQPVYDPATGGNRWNCYLLAPGRYAYGFHDPEGRYGDLAPTLLKLEESMAEVEVALSLVRTDFAPAAQPAGEPLQIAGGQPADTTGAAAVSVFFRCAETSDFSRLTVYDANGNSVPPLRDTVTGRVLYDSYLLTPGSYSYRFQDPSGRYEGSAAGFSVGGYEVQYINLSLNAALTGQSFSGTFINPVYSGLISEADLPASSRTPEQRLAQLQQLVEILSAPSTGAHSQSMVYGAQDTTVHDSAASAGTALKRALLQRQPEITILYGCSDAPTEENWRRLCMAVYNAAIVHNGVPTEGDYLRYEYGGVKCDGAVTSTTLPGVYVYEFSYSPLYFTTAAQENELNGAVAGILANLRISEMDNAQKIDAIYRYLCENVGYDGSRSNLIFTAYDALVNGRAVCQGVAVAFYRLCLEAGVDARVVTDVGQRHAWNIASPDGVHYYALDATWDSGKTPASRQYFMKGRESWLNGHVLGDQFVDGSFASYDFPAWDYTASVPAASADSEAVLHSVSLLFDGMLRIKYYFTFSNRLMASPGACVSFRKAGSEIQRIPLSMAKVEEGKACFYYSVNASEIADSIQTLILDGDGQMVELRSRNGTAYPAGFTFSAMDYAKQMKQSGSSEGMRMLAAALEEYGTAAQIYFKTSGSSGLSVGPAVRSVSAGDLAAWNIETGGTKPAGLVKTSVSVMFEADNSLRLYFSFDGTVDPFAFRYGIDGAAAALSQRSDGACYLSVNNIPANQLDTAHTFIISDGVNTYVVTASVLGYAKTAIERGSTEVADLGRALYLYNRAARAYFG